MKEFWKWEVGSLFVKRLFRKYFEEILKIVLNVVQFSMFNTPLISGCQFPSSKCWKLKVDVQCSPLHTQGSPSKGQKSIVQCSLFNIQCCSMFKCWSLIAECWTLSVDWMFFVLCSPLSVQCSTLKHQCWRLVEGWSSCCLLCDAFLLAVEASYHQTQYKKAKI